MKPTIYKIPKLIYILLYIGSNIIIIIYLITGVLGDKRRLDREEGVLEDLW